MLWERDILFWAIQQTFYLRARTGATVWEIMSLS
jgi:hypothetical protein